MKLAVIYNPQDPKVSAVSYSQCYRNMLLALVRQFDEVQHVTKNCSAKDIEADVIVIYDIHSIHEIEIDGLINHKAIKYTYLDDPHQRDSKAKYPSGLRFHKLDAGARIKRAFKRGVNYIICPYEDSYYRFFSPFLGKQADSMRVYFPVVPDIKYYTGREKKLTERNLQILANGAGGAGGYFFYHFRNWAFSRPSVKYVPHYVLNVDTPKGNQFPEFLTGYSAALAMCENHAVPKYFEIPLAGCLAFMEWNRDAHNWGFRHGQNCIFVSKYDFDGLTKHFLHNVADYQPIATLGRRLVEENYTADHFGKFIYNHAKERVKNEDSKKANA